jgi:hypothetical protein
MNCTVSTQELAQLLNKSPATIRRWVKDGKIKPISPLVKDRFGPDALRILGVVTEPMETAAQRTGRGLKILASIK